MDIFRRVLAGLTLAALILATPLAIAQTYPSRPIRIVVPYPTGGGADALVRQIAKRMSEEWKEQVIVENKPGANGTIGARDVANAAADGYSFVLVTDGLYSIAPHLLPPGGNNPIKDLAPVIHLVDVPLVIAVRPGLDVENLQQLIALAKRRPNDLTFAANNNTSTHYLASEILQKQAGIKMRHVPYAGAAQALPDFIGGQIDIIFGQTTALDSALKAGRGVKYIAVTTAQRFETIADVPTVAEVLPGYHQPAAMGLMAPAATPAPIIASVNALINKILNDKSVRHALMETGGAVPTGGTPQEFRDLIDRQLAARAPLIAELGLSKAAK